MRHDDWQSVLFEAVDAKKQTEFKYGQHDCCTAAADVIKTVFGIDLMDGVRGRYRSAAGASRVIRQEGFETLQLMVEARVIAAGGRPVPPAFAGMGDLVMTDQALNDQIAGEAVGICIGRKFLFPGEIGWINLRRGDLTHAFRLY